MMTIEFEEGKKYKSRGGEVFTVLEVDRACLTVWCKNRRYQASTINLNGTFDSCKESPYDLIEEYIEPEIIVGYINVYEEGMCANDTEEDAVKNAGHNMIERLKVTYKGGEEPTIESVKLRERAWNIE